MKTSKLLVEIADSRSGLNFSVLSLSFVPGTNYTTFRSLDMVTMFSEVIMGHSIPTWQRNMRDYRNKPQPIITCNILTHQK